MAYPWVQRSTTLTNDLESIIFSMFLPSPQKSRLVDLVPSRNALNCDSNDDQINGADLLQLLWVMANCCRLQSARGI